MDKLKIRIAVDRILDDISDRKGLGAELDMVDESIKQDMVEKWINIIFNTLTE